MANKGDIFTCELCGNVVEILHAGSCDPVCCDKPMTLMAANTSDGAKEKHLPTVTHCDDGLLVTVGTVQHPMEAKHYIMWVELSANGISYRRFLKPGDKPEVLFPVKAEHGDLFEYCNLHGLWKSIF